MHTHYPTSCAFNSRLWIPISLTLDLQQNPYSYTWDSYRKRPSVTQQCVGLVGNPDTPFSNQRPQKPAKVSSSLSLIIPSFFQPLLSLPSALAPG